MIAYRWIAAADHDEIARQRAVTHRSARCDRGTILVIRPDVVEQSRGRHDLHVRRGHEQLAGVARVQRVATLGLDNEDSPVGVREFRRIGQGIDRLTQRGRGVPVHRPRSRAGARPAGGRTCPRYRCQEHQASRPLHAGSVTMRYGRILRVAEGRRVSGHGGPIRRSLRRHARAFRSRALDLRVG